MGKALYRKYRSKNLSEIVGQEHITATLDNALKKEAISHAYLFTGPRGVGKTSIARILAHEVNQLPYDDSSHLDIIEIDAASNRRIDEIRNLREHVHTAPTSGKYKVYIIDEVHMLTKEAFNALLKTLEEPPSHVIFILATTEAHKLPETIISRTQRFTFKPVDKSRAVEHLRFIAESEKVNVDDEALELIADHGQGSFRDSISLLDQVSSGKEKVSIEDVRSMLGIAPDTAIDTLTAAIKSGEAKTVLGTLEQLRSDGYHTPQLAKQLAGRLRNDLMSGENMLPVSTTTELLTRLIDIPASHDPDTLLELVLLGACKSDETVSEIKRVNTPKEAKPKSVDTAPAPSVKDSAKTPEATVPATVDTPAEATDKPTQPAEPETVELTKKEVLLDEGTWQEALNELKKKHNTLYGIARMASPTFSNDTVTLTFAFPFHQRRLDDAKHKKVLADILSHLMGSDIQVICTLQANSKKPGSGSESDEPAADIDTISNIFGSAEVLE